MDRSGLIDFDLHGIVGIRLVDASPGDIAAVARQLGPLQAPLIRPPDITLRFVDRLELNGPVHYLGVDEAGFTDDAFLVLRSKHKAQARVRLPFDRLGQALEIVCERGLPAVPLLVPVINLTALARGALALHASAFEYNGWGVLNTGWSKGGKTEALLAFTSHGARYIGDEWVYIGADGRSMYGIPEPVRVWDWHLQQLPHFRPRIGRGDQARLRAIKMAQSVEKTASAGPLKGSLPASVLRRAGPVLKSQLYVDVPPERLFHQSIDSLHGILQKVFFVASRGAPGIDVRPIPPEEVASRMVFSLEYERLRLTSYYLAFRFAFPELRNEWIEASETIQRERLLSLLSDKETYAVDHPYPVSLQALFEAMCPYVG